MSHSEKNEPSAIVIGSLVVSDRASSGVYQDRGFPAIRDYLADVMAVNYDIVNKVIPDEGQQIQRELIWMADQRNACVILTTGGTGPAPRDVTPEATQRVCDKMMPGFGEAMRAVSLTKVPTAILSRQTAGIYGRTLIINLPGNPKAISECLDAVFAAIPYCVDLIGGPRIETKPERLAAFRPKGK